MLYAFLCYNNEDTVFSWSDAEDAAVMEKLEVVHERLRREGRMGPALRLTESSNAATLVKERDLVLDGPYAETKEALLGFYVIDCDDRDHALAIARELGVANPGGAYEVRPIRLFLPGVGLGAYEA